MRTEDIVSFVQKHVEPLPAFPPYGPRYRVSATLSDNTSLPCVVIESARNTVELAIKRFQETRNSVDLYMGYEAIVKNFVTHGNTVNDYDLKEIIQSPFAFPMARMREINGETSMGWTEFSATMRDGKEFRFGTTFLTEFFDMPTGYQASDIVKVVPAVRGQPRNMTDIYREKPFFTCYVEGL